ncbi:MAG: beta-propeller domain-containing protein, partial [bacterium]|nr:beta-propeller domain-containing protein [bacterium]
MNITKNMNKLTFKIGIAVVGLFILVGGAAGYLFLSKKEKEKSSTPPVTKKEQSLKEKLAAQKTIKKFSNYQEMAEFLEKSSSESYGGGLSTRALMAPASTSDGAFSSFAESQSFQKTAPSTPDYSKTNVQVEGVDEADIIKTDGSYIYALVRNTLHIIKSS